MFQDRHKSYNLISRPQVPKLFFVGQAGFLTIPELFRQERVHLLRRHLPDKVFDLIARRDYPASRLADIVDFVPVTLPYRDNPLHPLRQGLGIGLE